MSARPLPVTLAGATFRQDELSSVYHKTNGLPFVVTLKHEAENLHDADAIAVYDGEDRMLGYIPRGKQVLYSCRDGYKTAECYVDYWDEKGLYLGKLNGLLE